MLTSRLLAPDKSPAEIDDVLKVAGRSGHKKAQSRNDKDMERTKGTGNTF